MTTGNLVNRLAKLEQAYSPERLVVIIRRSSGPLAGYEFGDYEKPKTLVDRMPEEADEALLERARRTAIAARPGRSCVVLHEVAQ